MAELVCWKCGQSIAALSLPLTHTDECRACAAPLHACKLCEFYDVRVAKHCREVIAEEVREKDRANYCDYFKPRPDAYTNTQSAADAAKRQLDALFGGSAPKPSSPEDEARAKLEELFRKK